MGRTPAGQTRERVFRLVRERLLSGAPPTVREVQQAFGFRSVETAREHLEALVREGRLDKQPGRARGYRLPSSDGPPTVMVPLLGRVPAGSLDAAVEELEGYLPIQSRHSPDRLFGLRVRGESMTGAGILPGDVVVVRRQRTASSGEIVVALVGDEATVKRLRLRGKRDRAAAGEPGLRADRPRPTRADPSGQGHRGSPLSGLTRTRSARVEQDDDGRNTHRCGARATSLFSKGASHPEELVQSCADAGARKSVALTDRDGIYGVVEAHTKARETGVHV